MLETFALVRRVEAGPGCVGKAGYWAARLGTRAFVGIGGGSVLRSGALARVEESLAEAGVSRELFEGIEPEPCLSTVDRGAALARDKACDVFVALGGGSVIDTVKLIALLSSHQGPAGDYQLGRREFTSSGYPIIAAPTTAGTGSEATKVSVMTNPEISAKKSIYSWEMVPAVVLLDAELTVGLPLTVTRNTGLDALGQAIEGYLSTAGNPVTSAAAARAVTLVSRNLPLTVRDGRDLAARQNMLFAAFLSGIAIGTGVGLGHELAMAVGSYTKLPHGLLVGILNPWCLEANLGWAEDKIAELALFFGLPQGPDNAATARSLVEALFSFNSQLGLERSLGELGLREQDIGPVLKLVPLSTNIRTNPRPLEDTVRERVLRAAIRGEVP